MAENQTEKAEEIYCAAAEIKSPEQRELYLGRACAGDPGLHRLVLELLAAQAAADHFFQEGGLARLPVNSLSKTFERVSGDALGWDAMLSEDGFKSRFIGSYRLLQKIGEGGCGVVYMAEQERPVRRRVALKIIKLGMDTRNVAARFEAEREALALMDSPNIARVLDAGATPTGRPYFVMELVRGVKITEYCDQNELDTSERLQLFVQVCRAVQHAHQKGVIHRDIKPSNILVTMVDGVAVPKVIDFGIAKAIEGRLGDSTVFTAYEQFIGTPAYMSPEQAVMSGTDVDTRSDIYSLGVLLYELLAGRPPFETTELLRDGIDGLRRTLQERDPQPPSAIITTMQGPAQTQLAQRRKAEPPKLISLLRGDLDWIVIRALEKDRARRYQTAHGLALDVQRFLDNEPVTARPPSRWYQLQKLVQRNKVTFTAGALIILALVLGLAASLWFWRQEREERRRAVAAEKVQTELRQQAEDRERVAEAAYDISQGKLTEADGLVARASTFLPSLEAESVLRSLGEWNALNGRWDAAAQRFQWLLQVDQRDNAWEITDDLLEAGPIQIERGDIEGYEHFRKAAIARYAGTTDPVFAERTLKISLLLPADASMMRSLEPFMTVAANSLKTPNYDDVMEAWRCVSLALMAYRQGHYLAAEDWCQKCVAYGDQNPARNAAILLIRAMSEYRLADTGRALADLAQARALVNAQFANSLQEGNGASGFWYDWLFARITLREADGLFKMSPSIIH